MPHLELHLFRSLPATLALRLILLSLTRDILRIPAVFSFSQGAEDILIPDIAKGMLGITNAGNYVDVGCNAPMHYSNTFNLYMRGWRGLNIDANCELIKECRRVRREDVSICAAVSDSEREATFYRSKDTHLVATIDEKQLSEWKKHWDYAKEDEEIIHTKTLTSILDEHWKYGNSIDLLTVDVEGQDFNVLKGLDFEKYRPKIIVIEKYIAFEDVVQSDVYLFLAAKGYRLKNYAFVNLFFWDAKQ